MAVLSDNSRKLLKEHELRITPVRSSVVEMFLAAGHQALSTREIEDRLDNADRITLYRTLKSFEKKGLIHQVVDGSGAPKYALCSSGCSHHEHNDDHAHFHCEGCGKTYCLDGDVQTKVSVPKGFKIARTNLVLEGFCDHCSKAS